MRGGAQGARLAGWRPRIARWISHERLEILLALLVPLLLGAGLHYSGALAPVQTAWEDAEARLLAPNTVARGVLVVDVDEASLAALRPQFGGWPLRRDLLALAADYLMDVGARAVVIDLILADPRDDDAVLARVLRERAGHIVLAAGALEAPSDQDEAPSHSLRPGGCPFHVWRGFLRPTSRLDEAAAGNIGIVAVPGDADGRLRSMPLWHAAHGRLLAALPLAAVVAARGAGPALPHCERGKVRVAGLTLPMDVDGRVWPVYGSRFDSIPKQPFVRVVRAARGAADDTDVRAAVRDRIIFIGSSAAFADRVQTVHGQRTGADVLAATTAALQGERVLAPPRPMLDVGLLLMACLPALLAWCRKGPNIVVSLATVAVTILALLLAGAVAYGAALQRSQVVWPVLTVGGFGLLMYWQWRRRLAASRQILQRERTAAQAANRAKSEFVAHVSHEIRTPLNALLGTADLLGHTRLDAQQRSYVDMFHSAGASLMDILNDLLDLSRMEAGSLELRPQPFSLSALVASQAGLFEARAQQKGLQLVTEFPGGLPTVVEGDPRRLAQVLRNLLGNALKFTDQGGVTLTVLRVDGQPGRFRFEIRDTGIGIAPDRQEAIFASFEQADREVAFTHGGTGLGLAISQRLVTLMGGTIGVRSGEDSGALFHFEVTLPERTGTPPTVSSGSVAVVDTSPLPPLDILMVDDHPHNVLLVKAYLNDDGVRIDVVRNGTLAVESFRARCYDVVLMDMQMPGMDGYQATAALRAIERERGDAPIPMIALTGDASEEDEVRARAAGSTTRVTKPFSRAQLRQAVGEPTDTRGSASGRALLTDAPHPIPLLAVQPGFEIDAALDRMGAQCDLYLEVLAAADSPLRDWQESFAQAVSLGDGPRACRLAHDLSSIGATLGAEPLSRAARDLEKALRATRDPVFDDAQVHRLHALASQQLTRLLSLLGSSGKHGVDSRG